MKLAHLLNVLTLWTTETGRKLVGWHGYAGTIAFLRNTWTGRWLRREFFASPPPAVKPIRPNALTGSTDTLRPGSRSMLNGA